VRGFLDRRQEAWDYDRIDEDGVRRPRLSDQEISLKSTRSTSPAREGRRLFCVMIRCFSLRSLLADAMLPIDVGV
jgi:hypothetical protein